ncbi:hypothetical protein BSL78_24537 [Apostichopus japonicus]|uniref:Uncharacterized protein n=1 Tax=Stichopus japonicus TaxID=307972 RepID=A0A2G8JS79_STIJA|nr:hypothetical protein BSL78_24537 [Apostichopus japonicus]
MVRLHAQPDVTLHEGTTSSALQTSPSKTRRHLLPDVSPDDSGKQQQQIPNPGWAHRGQQTIQNKITTNGPLCATNNTNNEGVKPIPHQPDKGTLQQKVLHSLDGFTAHRGQIPSPNRHLTRRKWLVMRTPCAILHAKSLRRLSSDNTQTATHLERWRSGKPTGTQARALNETMVGITQRGHVQQNMWPTLFFDSTKRVTNLSIDPRRACRLWPVIGKGSGPVVRKRNPPQYLKKKQRETKDFQKQQKHLSRGESAV